MGVYNKTYPKKYESSVTLKLNNRRNIDIMAKYKLALNKNFNSCKSNIHVKKKTPTKSKTATLLVNITTIFSPA